MARYRPYPLMAMGMVALLAALWAGLTRMGWQLPGVRPGLAALHGPLMVSGFLGTLISLERAVALGRGWTFAAPLLTGLGALSLVAGLPGSPGPLLTTAGSLVLLAVFAALFRLEPTPHVTAMGLGALSWFVGNALWLAGWPLNRVVLWWAGFLVLTIAGERLELSRLLRLSRASRASFLGAAGLFLAGLAATAGAFDLGVRLAGAGMVALALWLARHDVARRTVRQGGLPRFIALSLLSGYVWLAVAGVLAVLLGGVEAGPRYDAMLHALFLGFVFAMIFGHAPIIFPALLGIPVPFRPAFYAHWIVLQLSLILRLYGDLAEALDARAWGGLLNAVAVLIFLANTVRSAGLGLRAAQNPPTVS